MPRTRTYGLDIDTINYAARVKAGSGVTILPENLKEINKFVVGAKQMGVWNSLLCWPMRSIHNAGTGSTVYSLGGYGIHNGVMQNNPEWSYNGLFFKPNTYVNLITYQNFPYGTNQYGISMFGLVQPQGWITTPGNANITIIGSRSGQEPIFHLTSGVGGGASMNLQVFTVNYNPSDYGASYVNNYMRLFGATNTNTNLEYRYSSKYIYTGFTPSNTAQNCSFIVNEIATLNQTSYQPVNSFGTLPKSSIVLISGVGSSNMNNAIIACTGFCTTPLTNEQHQTLRKLINATIGKNLQITY